MAKIENIAVIGAGLMGHGLAQIFAVHGYPVKLMDIKEELLGKAIENARSINPDLQVLSTSSFTGEGLEAWTDWLSDNVARCKRSLEGAGP